MILFSPSSARSLVLSAQRSGINCTNSNLRFPILHRALLLRRLALVHARRDRHAGPRARRTQLAQRRQIAGNQWRRAASLAWNAALARILKISPLLRLSVHPPDYSHPAIWGQIVDLINASEGVRAPITYQDWVAEQRLKRGV